jgi:hypothetical protein
MDGLIPVVMEDATSICLSDTDHTLLETNVATELKRRKVTADSYEGEAVYRRFKEVAVEAMQVARRQRNAVNEGIRKSNDATVASKIVIDLAKPGLRTSMLSTLESPEYVSFEVMRQVRSDGQYKSTLGAVNSAATLRQVVTRLFRDGVKARVDASL